MLEKGIQTTEKQNVPNIICEAENFQKQYYAKQKQTKYNENFKASCGINLEIMDVT